ncbi:MAG: hypothetical protein ACRDTJ_11820 [Pseudonocardiaceae bacterium]
MVAATQARPGQTEQTLIIDLPLSPEAGHAEFSRADVVIQGLDHGQTSYEVRLYLNNPTATTDTPRTIEHGYAGRITVFGHGGCYGDPGHCDVPPPSTDPTDLRPPHSLTPLDTYVTITDALRAILQRDGGLHTLTLVPVSTPPLRANRKPAPELLRFNDVSLHTYLAAPDTY